MNELFPILSESHLSLDADLVAVEVVGLLVDFSVFVEGGYRGNRAVFTIAVELDDQLENATVGIAFSKQQPYVAGWGDLVEVVWKAETATPYVVEISCELRLAIVISNDAEQLSFKKGTTFVRKTMIY